MPPNFSFGIRWSLSLIYYFKHGLTVTCYFYLSEQLIYMSCVLTFYSEVKHGEFEFYPESNKLQHTVLVFKGNTAFSSHWPSLCCSSFLYSSTFSVLFQSSYFNQIKQHVLHQLVLNVYQTDLLVCTPEVQVLEHSNF